MAVSSTTQATGVNLGQGTASGSNPKAILGKDDFLKLLLVELQNQDPTEPMDSEKILAQTSQLATLESSKNTNEALSNLSTSLINSQQFSTIGSIGKIADLGNDKIVLEDGGSASFDIYFPTDVKEGEIEITNKDGEVIKTIAVGANSKGVYNFEFDGIDNSQNPVKEGIYAVNAVYKDNNDISRSTRLGAYPIESVRFEEGKTLVKLGSSYVPFENIKEVYNQ